MSVQFANGRPRGQIDKFMSASKIDSPSHLEISARAEEIYRESGCIPGRDLENWVRAENELKQRSQTTGATPKAKAATNGKANGRTPREKQRV
jgi:hypothetical protein